MYVGFEIRNAQLYIGHYETDSEKELKLSLPILANLMLPPKRLFLLCFVPFLLRNHWHEHLKVKEEIQEVILKNAEEEINDIPRTNHWDSVKNGSFEKRYKHQSPCSLSQEFWAFTCV